MELESICNALPKAHKIATQRGGALEIEVRIFLDVRVSKPAFVRSALQPTQAIDLCKRLLQDKTTFRQTMSQTICFVGRQHEHVKCLVFERGVQCKDRKLEYTKHQLAHAVLTSDSVSYRFSVSVETPAPAPSKGSSEHAYDLVRGKLRCSLTTDIDELRHWRVDITLIKTVSGATAQNVAALTSMRDKLFKGVSADDFAGTAPWAYADAIEVELEYIGDAAFTQDHLTAVDQLMRLLGAEMPNENVGIFNELTSLLRPAKTFKQLMPQVRELTAATWQQLGGDIANYWLTDKADGIRTVLLLKPQDATMLAFDGTTTVTKSIPRNAAIGRTVADVEYIPKLQKYFIFDVPVYDGKSTADLPFEQRRHFIDKVAALGNGALGADGKGKSESKSESSPLAAKQFAQLTSPRIIRTFYEEALKRLPYEIDGLIITSPKGYWDVSYKWKPIDKMTIDFLVMRCPRTMLGIMPFVPKPGMTLYLLFLGIDRTRFIKRRMVFMPHYNDVFEQASATPKRDYFPVQFSPADQPLAFLFYSNLGTNGPDLHGKVCELVRKDDAWVYVKTREDRQQAVDQGTYFGNDYDVAESIWRSYKAPLTLEMLAGEAATTERNGVPAQAYFKVTSKLHQPIRRATRFAIYKAFDKWLPAPHNKTIIDIASGKGQDIRKYARMGATYVLFIERDKAAIAELMERIKAMPNPNVFHVLEADLQAPWQTTLRKITDAGHTLPAGDHVDAVICNLALHYFAGSAADLDNIIALIAAFKPATFIYTAFDGQQVFDLLEKNNGRYDVRDAATERLKYSIVRDYVSKSLTGVAQGIKVMLPMSSEEYYKEFLLKAPLVQKKLAAPKLRYKCAEYVSLATYLEAYKTERPKDYAEMADDDKAYLALYYVGVFKK